jgi:hypothetical protein
MYLFNPSLPLTLTRLSEETQKKNHRRKKKQKKKRKENTYTHTHTCTHIHRDIQTAQSETLSKKKTGCKQHIIQRSQ